MAFPGLFSLIMSGINVANKAIATQINNKRKAEAQSQAMDLQYQNDMKELDDVYKQNSLNFSRQNELFEKSMEQQRNEMSKVQQQGMEDLSQARGDVGYQTFANKYAQQEQGKIKRFGKEQENIKRWGL